MSRPASYMNQIRTALRTALKGMRLTMRHYRRGKDLQQPLGIDNPAYFQQAPGPVTIQYPAAKVPVPDTGRYRLHMETEDCIGCDKCARICPVDCITIETFRADGDLGKTSDGTLKRLHLPVFDIDMGKCMYCGLCTTVCPTECLTMTKVYDFSEYDRDNLVYHFGAYSPEEEQRVRRETEEALARKKAVREPSEAPTPESPARPRTVLRRPVTSGESTEGNAPDSNVEAEKPAIVRPRPMMKRAESSENPVTEEPKAEEQNAEAPVARPRPRPLMKRAESSETPVAEEPQAEEQNAETPVARPRPLMKRPAQEEAHTAEEPKVEEEKPALSAEQTDEEKPKAPRPRPLFKRPTPEPPQEP